jgi:hypothetical protein
MEFKLIRADKEMKNLDKLGYRYIFFLFVAFPAFGLLIWQGLPLIFAVPFLFGFWIFGYKLFRTRYKDWKVSNDIIGSIDFSNNVILANSNGNNDIKFEDIARLDLKYNYIKGKSAFRDDVFHNGIWYLKFQMKSGDNFEFKFVVENTEQFDYLAYVLRLIYRAGAKVKERLGNEEVKTILFQIQPSYAEIQALKSDLGVDSFE